MKVRGATRRRLRLAYSLESGGLGVAAALFDLRAGRGGAWAIVTKVMRLDFALGPHPPSQQTHHVPTTTFAPGTTRSSSQLIST